MKRLSLISLIAGIIGMLVIWGIENIFILKLISFNGLLLMATDSWIDLNKK